jgi:ureidoacrylate peracid hydrolase
MIRWFAGIALSVWAATAAAQAPVRLPPLDKTLKPQETAIILVDFQNNFAAPQGEHFGSYAKMLKDGHIIENAVDLVHRARALGILVVEVTEGYSSDYRELDWGNGAGFHRGQILRQAWKSGSWGVQLIDALRPKPNDNDILLPNRITVSGFGNNGLDTILKARGIRNIAVGGFSIEGCVYATMLDGYDLGFRVFALPDVMASDRDVLAPLMLKDRYPQYSRVMSHRDFLAMFPGNAVTPKPE